MTLHDEGKRSATIRPVSRRKALKLAASGAAAAAAGLAAPAAIAAGKDKILIGVPSSLSTPYGVADDTDHLNGTTMAVEEINAAGGVLGREIELFVPDVDKLSPESCRQSIAACIDKKVHAISNAFLFAPIPAMDESAKYKCPYLQGNTQRNATLAYKADPKKYSHVLQTDPSEVNYGWTYPLWLTKMEETGVWKPKNRKIHIVAEQVGLLPDHPQGGARVDPEIQIRARGGDRHPIPGQRLEPGHSEAQGSRCRRNHDRPLGRCRIRRLLQAVFSGSGAWRDRLSAVWAFAA